MSAPTGTPGPSQAAGGPGLRYAHHPYHPPVGGRVRRGWDALAADLAPGQVLAVDGPAVAPWSELATGLATALRARGLPLRVTHAVDGMLPWEQVVERTVTPGLREDPHFEALPAVALRDLFDRPAAPEPAADGVAAVLGPGAALSPHDVLWYLDLPKRYAEAAVGTPAGRHVGRPDVPQETTAKRLFYTDWPLLDAHRDGLLGRLHRWIDGQDAARPAFLDGSALRATLACLSGQPFRTRPTFNTTSWGGHWGQRELGMAPEQENTALGYELIAPESGLLIGGERGVEGDGDGRDSGPDAVEVPLQALVARHPEAVLGTEVNAVFGTSFPIRFDYLDTAGGGDLSVHCHPQDAYMREVFGWSYTQHETYYMMVAGTGSRVFLGLRDGVDVAEFHREAAHAHDHAAPFDVTRHVQTFPAVAHQLYLVPAGTPHGSGKGNVVLEISATPYLYSLRFYDWLRRDRSGRLRPVHVDHAFRNLDRGRTGPEVGRTLVPAPRPLRSGAGWSEEVLGEHPAMFFDVLRTNLSPGATAPGDTAGRFLVLNVVAGQGLEVETAGTRVAVAYAETLVLPASCGVFRLHALGEEPVRAVLARVRSTESRK